MKETLFIHFFILLIPFISPESGCKYSGPGDSRQLLIVSLIMEQQTENQKPRKVGVWDQIKQYLFLKKRDPSDPRSVNFTLMHGMNRISIIVFLIAIIILIVRAITRD